MERLTDKHPKGGYFVLCAACPRHNKEECGLDDCVYVLTKRLAAYENTGLTPEEINKLDTQRDFASDHQNIWNGLPRCLARMDGGATNG